MSSFLKVAGYGLIGDDRKKGPFRQVIFEDKETGKSAELLVYKQERPSIWDDIEKLEKGCQVPPYKGSIVCYKFFDLVILGDETPEQVYEMQKSKLKIERISYDEAEKIQKNSKGFITDLTNPGAIEIGWGTIDKKAQMIKFRHYKGMGLFSWSIWYKIEH